MLIKQAQPWNSSRVMDTRILYTNGITVDLKSLLPLIDG